MNTTELGSRRLHVWRGRHHGSTRPHGLVDAVKEDTATLAEARPGPFIDPIDPSCLAGLLQAVNIPCRSALFRA
jgi:hypothetical protein